MLIVFSSTNGNQQKLINYINTLKEKGYQVSNMLTIEYPPVENRTPEYLFTMVINSIDDVFNISKILDKELIISKFPAVRGTHEIEIYDDYRE